MKHYLGMQVMMDHCLGALLRYVGYDKALPRQVGYDRALPRYVGYDGVLPRYGGYDGALQVALGKNIFQDKHVYLSTEAQLEPLWIREPDKQKDCKSKLLRIEDNLMLPIERVPLHSVPRWCVQDSNQELHDKRRIRNHQALSAHVKTFVTSSKSRRIRELSKITHSLFEQMFPPSKLNPILVNTNSAKTFLRNTFVLN